MASPAATGVTDRALLLVRRLRVDRLLGDDLTGFAGEVVDRLRAAKVNARRGAIGAGESLYFEDENALECAIVAASLHGTSLPELVRQAIPDSAVPLLRWRRRLLADARKLPRLIAALVEAGTAGAWLARFDAAELRTAGDLLLRAHGSAQRLPETGRNEPLAARTAQVRSSRGTAHRPAAIEQACSVAAAASATAPVRLLIAVALLAARRPELIATQALDDALARTSEAPAPTSSPSVRARLAESGTIRRRPGMETQAPARSPRSVPAALASTPRAVPVAGDRPPIRARQAFSPRSAPDGASQGPHRHGSPVPVATQAEIFAPPAAAGTRCVESAHAGLFFLLNIFLVLGLYGDFTDPAARVRGLSPFELLLLLARRWIGPRFARDPLAPTLHALAGLGSRERPGRNFEAPAWQTPPDWLAPWPEAGSRSVQGRSGTSRWHAAGFPIADAWRHPRPAAWLRRRWVACLARYIEARLARALGDADRAAALAMLVDRRGTVRIEPEQVAVAFELDTHPLALRLAGLDRDPGWIPAAGRTIRFRFT